MHKHYRKMLSVMAGVAVIAAAALPLAAPQTAAANWLTDMGRHIFGAVPVAAQTQQPNDAPGQPPLDAGQPSAEQPAPGTQPPLEAGQAGADKGSGAPNEAVITDKDGQAKRVTIISADDGTNKTVPVDKEQADKLQQDVDAGHQPWRLDPVQVVKNDGQQYGFDPQRDTFTLISFDNRASSGTGEAYVLVEHGDNYYLVQLTQPAGEGRHKIWQIGGIRQVKVIRENAPSVGPGVAGLDYDRLLKAQQAVDAGHELWRLDPLKVARTEGQAYGFTDQDKYTIVRKLVSSPIARHGEMDVQVEHNGQKYTMVLVRPFGSDDGAIWTTYQVQGLMAQPAPPAREKVLYSTDKYADWDWYRGAYPKDMAFATIVDYNAQLAQDPRIPETVLQKAKDVDYNSKVVLFAYLGSTGGGYNIGIEKVTMSGNNLTVQVRTKSPRPGEMSTMILTHPYDFVTIDRSVADVWGGVNVTFVDQKGKVLSKNRIVIEHR